MDPIDAFQRLINQYHKEIGRLLSSEPIEIDFLSKPTTIDIDASQPTREEWLVNSGLLDETFLLNRLSLLGFALEYDDFYTVKRLLSHGASLQVGSQTHAFDILLKQIITTSPSSCSVIQYDVVLDMLIRHAKKTRDMTVYSFCNPTARSKQTYLSWWAKSLETVMEDLFCALVEVILRHDVLMGTEILRVFRAFPNTYLRCKHVSVLAGLFQKLQDEPKMIIPFATTSLGCWVRMLEWDEVEKMQMCLRFGMDPRVHWKGVTEIWGFLQSIDMFQLLLSSSGGSIEPPFPTLFRNMIKAGTVRDNETFPLLRTGYQCSMKKIRLFDHLFVTYGTEVLSPVLESDIAESPMLIAYLGGYGLLAQVVLGLECWKKRASYTKGAELFLLTAGRRGWLCADLRRKIGRQLFLDIIEILEQEGVWDALKK